jgi:hypothetical protein
MVSILLLIAILQNVGRSDAYRAFGGTIFRDSFQLNKQWNAGMSTAVYLHNSEFSEIDNESRLYSTLLKASPVSKQGSELEELNREMRLGVLFLNLGGPETQEVRNTIY